LHPENSSDGENRPIAILAALREELGPIRKLLAERRAVEAEVACLRGKISGRPVVLVQTGIGVSAARGAADWIIRSDRPSMILAIGFAGGVRDGLRTGDLILAEEVLEPPAPAGQTRLWEGDAELLALAGSLSLEGLRVTRGRLATVREVIATGAGKRAFGDSHGVSAVEMESSGIARAANVHDTPVLYVRTILDEVDFDIPLDFSRYRTAGGRLRYFRILGALLLRPRAILKVLKLRGRAIMGAEALARFTAALIGALPSGG